MEDALAHDLEKGNGEDGEDFPDDDDDESNKDPDNNVMELEQVVP